MDSKISLGEMRPMKRQVNFRREKYLTASEMYYTVVVWHLCKNRGIDPLNIVER